MEPKTFETVGDEATKLNIKPGLGVCVEENGTKVGVFTDLQLQNPSINSSFKLPVGTVDCNIAKDGVVGVVLKPDLKQHGVTVSINPIEKNFTFSVKKECTCTHYEATLGYNSAKKAAEAHLYKQFAVKDSKVNCYLDITGVNNTKPDVNYRIRYDLDKIGLRTYWDGKDQRFAAFLDLKKAMIGTHFFFNKAVKSVDIYGLKSFKCGKASLIATVLGEQRCRLNFEGCCKDCSYGAKIDYLHGEKPEITAKFGGASKCCSHFSCKYLATVTKKEATTFGIQTSGTFPLHGFGKATVGCALADVKDYKNIGYSFLVELN
ncbi:hydrogenosomal membrane protein Hmp35 [Trichomonas vaginalis G3]|uniref:Hydrogenosomal membrane protein Hmp35 n=2 Tax=Trichomonas vaginalis (strain ATCC PRA-98 / G3) TaxID=412133 RepID=A2FTN9_TRIV3|nr:hydrogenosomal membrane protein Hmp35 [Trichomonas vaginalis G3]|eukprot:XP_001304674.1 hydrogenosomal membrane protein Hmp35 [Trichomonas vaginalis G3]